ncbi:MAG: FxsA family protein [Mycobacterium sp.]
MRPFLRYTALYAAVELTAVILLTWAVGIGWTLLVLAATFIVGVVLAATQLKGQVGALRQARGNPQGAVTDGVLVAAGSFLVFLPGVVSTAAGALMLAPPTRAAMRPLAAGMLSRGVMRSVGAMNLNQFADPAGRDDYIDGEVIDEPVDRPGTARTAIARRVGG